MRRTILALLAALGLTLAVAQPVDAATRGARWQQPVVYVYDGTSAGSLYAVAEAAAEWSASGVNLAMTTDPAAAHITVREEYVCGSLQCYAGHFTSTESGGVITVRRSVMNVSVNWDTAVTRPSSYDIREAKSLYGR